MPSNGQNGKMYPTKRRTIHSTKDNKARRTANRKKSNINAVKKKWQGEKLKNGKGKATLQSKVAWLFATSRCSPRCFLSL